MAFTATVEWDVRSTGSNSNGGGFDTATAGTDYSQQDSPQITYTDLVIDATTNTKATSAANPFTSAHVGNIINITGGAGFTVQRVQVLSVTSGVATCDKSLGTLSSTGGQGKLGGALATIAQAVTLLVSGQKIHLKNTGSSYTHTAATAIGVATMHLIGYNSTHNDDGSPPTVTTGTNSVDLFTTSGNSGAQTFRNLILSNTAGTRGNGFVQLSAHGTTQFWVFEKCTLDGFVVGINSDNVGSHFDVSNISIDNCEIKNCTSHGLHSNTGNVWVTNSWAHNNGGDGFHSTASVNTVSRSISSANTGSGFDLAGMVNMFHCVGANNTAKGVFPSATSNLVLLQGCIFYGNAANSDIFFTSTFSNLARSLLMSRNNAYGANTRWGTSLGDVTLSASPFTSSTDFSLNSTAGGGGVCKQAGFPGAFPGGSSTGYLDIGAVNQSSTAACDYPAVADVRAGTSYAGGASTGTLALPTAAQVLSGVGFGAAGVEYTGTVVQASVGDVRAGTAYGPSSGLTGTLALPTAAQVLVGTGFGTGGVQYNGTVTLPAASDVRDGVTFGPSLGSTGTVVLPDEADVLAGVDYGAGGTEFTGTAAAGGTASAYAWSF